MLQQLSRSDGSDAGAGSRTCAVRSILVHVQDDRALVQRLQAALSLARACGAHLQCVHITPVEAYVAFDGFGGVFVMNDVITALDEGEERIRQRVEQELKGEDVPWDYEQVTGNVASQIVRHGALNDLIVTGRELHQGGVLRSGTGLLGDVLQRSRTGLFIPATGSGLVDPLGEAVIAWDGSYEAANAVRSALGLLQIASNVRAVQVSEEGKDKDFPSTRLLEYLSRHGIKAELTVEQARDSSGEAVASVIVANARASGAAYVVMGGYNHSRVGEYLFGGVTRTLLEECGLPLVIAH